MPDGDAEDEIQRLRGDHPQQVHARRGFEPERARTPVDGPASERDAGHEAGPAAWSVAVGDKRRTAGRTATRHTDLRKSTKREQEKAAWMASSSSAGSLECAPTMAF